MKKYLTNREQIIKSDDCISIALSMCTRVPQGTVLRPLLSIPHINVSFAPKLGNCNWTKSLTGETTVISTGKKWKSAEKKLNENLQNINSLLHSINFQWTYLYLS